MNYDSEIRWITFKNEETMEAIIGLPPTPTDLLELADEMLSDSEEFHCCKTDQRLGKYKNIIKLIETLN